MAFPPPPVLQNHPNHHNQRLAELPPIWKNKLDHGIHLRLYKNGDEHYPGKEVTLNKKQFRTFESWLSDLSNSMRLRNGAVWRVYTPEHGTRKADFNDFEDGQTLVVAGQERFKPLRYDQITSLERKKSPPFKYDANPVVHNRRLQHSGKISKIQTQSKLIKVWANGDDLHAPRVVLLSPKTPFTLVNVMELVSESMKGLLNGPAEKLYLLNGIKVMDVEQITHNGQYVALKKTDRFKMCRYNESGTKNITTSPRLERKFLAPLNYSRSNNSTQSSPEHSNASTQNSVNGYPPRRRAARRDDEQVFPARPVKHTRSSEKARNVDLDKDQGGMFKAKQNNRTTHGAREVQETRHTRTELPVDQRQAKTVEEEKLPKAKKTTPTRNGPPTSSQNGGVEARANSKRTPPSQQQRQKPQKKESPANQYDDYQRQKSAAKIQAGFRGYKTRQELKSKQRRVDTPPRKFTPEQREYNSYNNNYDDEKERGRGQQSRERSPEVQSKPEPALQPENTLLGEEERAAAKIQAGFRGYQTRRQLKEKNDELERERRQEEEEERAAVKIQAGFRGYSSRKNTRSNMAVTPPPPQTPPPRQQQKQQQPREDSYDSLDREISAATKIQSSYRGYVARRELDRKREAAVILPLSHNEVDRGYKEEEEDVNRLGIDTQNLSPPLIDRNINDGDGYNGITENIDHEAYGLGDDTKALSPPAVSQSDREIEREPQAPLPHHKTPRSPTPPQVANDRAVDRFRSSLSDIHKAAESEVKSHSRPISSQDPPRAEGEANDNEVPKKQSDYVQDVMTRASPMRDHLTPGPQNDEAKAQHQLESYEPTNVENDDFPTKDEEFEPRAVMESTNNSEDGGKQNGHANPIVGNETRGNDVSS